MSFRRVAGVSPLGRPDPQLVAALARAGALGILDLTDDAAEGAAAMRALGGTREFGVRLSRGADLEIPARASTVMVSGAPDILRWRGTKTVLAEVTSLDDARAAVAAGAHALVAKGHEAGGAVGEETTFVLVQRIAAAQLGVPVYAMGGIGVHSAAAAIAGGASGVLLCDQLALLAEATTPAQLRPVLGALDGSETVVEMGPEGGARVLVKPGAPRLPCGQDAAFARPLAERFRTAANLVRGIDQAIDAHLRQAQALQPLAPGARWARQHGLQYPIAQGPMTRVSDRAAFAAAVAAGGGLPLIAVSLMRGAELRTLLEETRAACGDRTWGVGVLGFAPPELRDEQLAAIAAVRPPVALIAGGRPAQAKPLEEQGIVTYLHVPSPGLLDMFLKEGARRFVLEGRECGGHVGPRSSFVLWDAAIERLARDPAAGQCSVVFAGGIHDARSAAMVAAAAAPLAARGARIGVLMGTAYLFTEEAVASGAIVAGFQEAAVACEQTVLLETAPGHATRCAETDYVRAFRDERAKLEAAGVETRQMWEQLEQLNLGRLRIASKGLVRSEEGIHEVDGDAQRREGMYMIGQVAALRRSVTTVAALHADVSAGGASRLGSIEVPREVSARTTPRIAIVGMAGIFPGAPDLETYWGNIVHGRDAVTEVPRDRWNVDAYYDPAGTGDKTPSKWGGFLAPVAFDPASFGIPPKALAAIEPVQLLALEVARRALADAGYDRRDLDRERVSVVFGAEAGTDLSNAYGFRAQHRQFLGELPGELDDALPTLSEDSFPGILANVIAGRIANRLDLGGVNFTVDAACASSLAAIDVACKELAAGETDAVLCGGADLHNSVVDYLMFASVHALSKTGRCKTFDGAADGIALGEGVACVMLKRLEDAERDGDRVYAVIEGVAGSSDGKSLGLTAPRKEGQVRALERAYRRAAVSPAEVELVEAHGTGTVVGDRTELETLTEIFGGAGARPAQATLGSVKSNIGHTKCAAGLAGVIKAALAIHRRVLPPTVHVKDPNPFWDAETSPFAFRDRAAPWASSARRAGVSAFGFGGTNFHAVLSDGGVASGASGVAAWPSELFLIRDDQTAARLEVFARGERPAPLRELARAAFLRGAGPVRRAFVASSHAELIEKLRASPAATPVEGRVAVLFPGQGSQRPGMLDELFVAFPWLHEVLDGRLLGVLYPGAAFTPDAKAAQRAAITDTRVAQPALGMVDLAAARLLEVCGVRGELLGGHSYGELVALAVAGALPASSLLPVSKARAEHILAAARGAPGTMAAVRAGAAVVEDVCAGLDVVAANRNAPEQTVIAGPEGAVNEACARLEARGIGAKRIPVACAFHSPVVAGAVETFGGFLREIALAAPSRTVFANTTAAPYPASADGVRELLARQVGAPVRWAEQVEAMYAAGARVFVEAGPGQVLSDLVGKVLGSRPHVAVSIDRGAGPAGSGLASFLDALARLATAGVAIDAAPLFAGRCADEVLDLDAEPAKLAPTTWLIDGQRARPVHGELPAGAFKPVLEPVRVGPSIAAAGDPREQTVLAYLEGMREMVSTQREIMLRYLGTEPAETRPRPSASVTASVTATVSTASATATASVSPHEALVAILAERTGYPPDMLDPDLDLEADLGVDSIKRIEILGALGEKLGLGGGDAAERGQMVEELAKARSIRQIATWLENKLGAAPAPAPAPAPAAAAAPAAAFPLRRFVVKPLILPAAQPNGFRLEGRKFVVTDDGRGVATALARELEKRNAHVTIGTDITGADGVIHLAPLSTIDDDHRKLVFDVAQRAVSGGAQWLCAATGGKPEHGGVAALLKSVAKEHPQVRVRAIDLDPGAHPEAIAGTVLAELLADDPHVHVAYEAGERRTFRAVETDARDATTPLGPPLGPDDVVLITGGARGITARAAIALARAHRCAIELVGRTPAPGPEDAELAAAPDASALRKVLATRGERVPARIEAQVKQLLAARELRATFAALDASGAPWRYHAADVRDAAAVEAVLADLYARRGRLDAIIHGAGVIEDRLMRDKTRDSFDRVFDTKVAGARALLAHARDDLRLVVFFSSVSGVFGNRGQTDYAAANEALDHLARDLARTRPRTRVLSVAWGPWGGTGMISPELEREYAQRGVGLIDPEAGVARLLAELGGDDPHVVYMSATPEALE